MVPANHTDDESLFEILPGLPGTGPYPEQFSATGRGTFSEGFVVRFFPEKSDFWVGNFQPGGTRLSRAVLHPNRRTVLVISSGQAYYVDLGSRALIQTLAPDITDVVVSPAHGLLVLVGFTTLTLMYSNGRVRETERIAWDGITDLAFGEKVLYGMAWDCLDEWVPFAVDIDSGNVRRAPYSDWREKLNSANALVSLTKSQAKVIGLALLTVSVVFLLWRISKG